MNIGENKEPSRSEAAYRQLLEAIRTGGLKPGTRVREAELAQRFGISRTPVRDAIRRLEQDGLVVHVPRAGAVVRQLDHREVNELYEMRSVLEGTAARMAAVHASEIEILELEELNETMLREAGNVPVVKETSLRWHAYLHQAAKNRYLISSVTALSDALLLLNGTTLDTTSRVEAAYAEHAEIIKGLRSRDPDEAERAARGHIEQALRARLRMLRKNLDVYQE